jgi:hypothetical protein
VAGLEFPVGVIGRRIGFAVFGFHGGRPRDGSRPLSKCHAPTASVPALPARGTALAIETPWKNSPKSSSCRRALPK